MNSLDDELSRTAELLEKHALVEVVYLNGDILEVVGQHLDYIIALRDDGSRLWLFARPTDGNDDLVGVDVRYSLRPMCSIVPPA